jgi:carbon storage regulator
MLVVTRKAGDAIVIDVRGVEVEIHVVSVGSAKTKIGVDAPKDVVVLRKELQTVK